MPLAGAPRDLYMQLLACSSLQSVIAIACCLGASLCSGLPSWVGLMPGGATPIYGLYRYVPRNRVWFLGVSVLK